MKKIINYTSMLIFILFSSCEIDTATQKEKTEELGKQAAREFCDCYKNNSKDTCLDKLTLKYSQSDYMSDDFIKAFNRESPCDIVLEKTYLP